MSTDGIREGIVGALVTKLATITTGNGYQQNIGAVLDYPTHFNDIDRGNFPVASIVIGRTGQKYLLGNTSVDATMTIGLRCYVEGYDEDTIRDSANKLTEDINKCLFNNNTLGLSYVIDTKVMNMTPPFIWLDVGDVGMFDVSINVIYRRDLSA
jgi:hypothetical protein